MEEELLAKNDLKQTKRRKAVLAVLEAAGTPLSAEEIYGKVVTQVHMSVSTTYRILGVLTEKGLLLKSLSQDGKTYYQLSGTKHKHQLICTLCGESIPIDGCPLHQLEEELSKQTGYVITGHNLEFSGICPHCAKEMKES